MNEEEAKDILNGHVEMVLAGLGEIQFSGVMEDLKDVIQNANTEVTALTTTLQPVVADIELGFANIDQLANQAVTNLQAGQQKAQDFLTTFQERLGDVSELAGTTQEKIEASLDSYREVLDVVEEIKSNALEAMEEKVGEIIDHMVELVTEELVEPVQELRTHCLEKINTLISDLTDELIPNKTEEIAEEQLAEIQSKLSELTKSLTAQLDEFRSAIGLGKDKAESSRADSEGTQELLQSAFAPIYGEIERIKSLAGMVGIPI